MAAVVVLLGDCRMGIRPSTQAMTHRGAAHGHGCLRPTASTATPLQQHHHHHHHHHDYYHYCYHYYHHHQAAAVVGCPLSQPLQ
ncbi:uncharacterized protein SETTUDRAFT_161816 [Exserohilum turcica Et28A]|uniref:Uncharacterized protein n=1 Tax=Exserohilum turcicum (strain 28A) TaxID=671987 RepID=R0IKQ2_EXST2|nr:uncharacterized protein SETTUDRAFT_161816 [Exserohilum turcica Et28A]EOA85630.1 hypothetical protein SETTUDRAFT_161816 [Exserohilum turcica Et28A]